jgi:very-short-patch-repair endonuclease
MRDQEMIHYAKGNRQAMPKGERVLWWHLLHRRYGVKFRRQHPVGTKILDFACLPLKLNIEADGSQHISEVDRLRDDELRARGWTVLRFTNERIVTDIDSVMATIARTIEQLPTRER